MGRGAAAAPSEVGGAQPDELAVRRRASSSRGRPGRCSWLEHGDPAVRPAAWTTTSPGLEPLDRVRAAARAGCVAPAVPRPARRSGGGSRSTSPGPRSGGRRDAGPRASRSRSSCRSRPTTSRSALELRERQVQEVVRRLGRRTGARGSRHVVGRPERRRERVRAAGRERRDLVEGHERAPAHDRVPDIVDAAPPGPPGELGVLAGGEELVAAHR